MPDQPIERIFARNAIIHTFNQQLDTLSRTNSEKLENKVLVDLWRDLGDQTETYWQAMTATHDFVEAHNAVIERIDKLATPIKARLLRVLAEVFTCQADVMEQIQSLEAERDRKLAELS